MIVFLSLINKIIDKQEKKTMKNVIARLKELAVMTFKYYLYYSSSIRQFFNQTDQHYTCCCLTIRLFRLSNQTK